ncbi:SUKH-4 family immunity protein [Streptomyces sp. NPDC058664]|uniref:SUKH-4 family immunity protein n=1 Tax=unclassified Streptomyces TaxID=2593676 RepID=UPI003658EA0C
MVTFAQAQERAEEWINGDLPSYQHREVRVREFELGFVLWAEDREGGPTSDGGRQRLVIARDSGEATLWPGLPVGEVIRRYEEEYGAAEDVPAQAAVPAARIDLNQTSFLLSPPEWLQDAADRIGLPKQPNASQESGSSVAPVEDASDPVGAVTGPSASVASSVSSSGGFLSPAAAEAGAGAVPASVDGGAGAPGASGGSGAVAYEPTAMDGVPAETPAAPAAAAPVVPPAAPAPVPVSAPMPASAPASPPASVGGPWVDANASSGGADGAVPLPATVFAPALSGTDDEDAPPPQVGADAPTALMQGGSALPPTAVAPRLDPAAPRPGGAPATPPAPPAPSAPVPPQAGPPGPGGPGVPPPPAPAPVRPGAGDIADAATSKAALPPKSGRGPAMPPPPPGAPGVPGLPGAPGTPGASSGAGAYIPTQLVSQLGPEGPQPPAPPGPPPAPAPPGPPTPPQPVHHAATMLAHPSQGGQGAPPPPPPPPGAPGAPAGGIAHAATMLAHPGPGGPSAPQPPGPPAPPPPVHGGHTPPPVHGGHGGHTPPPAPVPPAYGYPQQPMGQPTVGPGYQAVLRYRAPDGSEAQIIRRSAPGTPHPEWQILHELRAMNVPPQQVLELHTELESCELPGGYCARMIRETWPQARITSIAPYGRDHAGRQQGMRQLLTHQGELHQVADGPARPAPVRAPLPQVQPAPPVPPEAIAQELAGAFGPGVLRFDQRAVSRQGVPEVVARTLVWAGLPADFGPFFWAQPAVPVVPTLAELAAQRQVPAAPDASSYLVLGSDFGRALCVQYGTAHIVAVPVEAGPGGQPVPPQFVNTGLPEFTRSMALLGRMWRLRFGLNPEQAGRWTVDFQAQLAILDPAALSSPENWWSVLLEQMWDGLL